MEITRNFKEEKVEKRDRLVFSLPPSRLFRDTQASLQVGATLLTQSCSAVLGLLGRAPEEPVQEAQGSRVLWQFDLAEFHL